jgi:NAD(P)-dependent dehydrogenase (short-subunit alcohol dehydrogenase family)
MKDFAGKVAVVTGAASGMGLAFATRFAQEGMKVVLADIEAEPLAMAEAAIKAKGGTALAIRTDLLHEKDIKRLADTAFATYGNVHILCNNAGVAGGTAADGVWNIPMEDWNWILGVNFSGVLHGIRHFVPRMLANGEEGHIVNTASVAGLTTGATGGPYAISKHGVVALSEILYKDLKVRNAKLSASVLCPGWVNTNIIDSVRNRPEELTPTGAPALQTTPQMEMRREAVRAFIKNGIQPEDVAGRVFDAIKSDTFYIIPAQPNIEQAVETRLDDIRLRRNPTIASLV